MWSPLGILRGSMSCSCRLDESACIWISIKASYELAGVNTGLETCLDRHNASIVIWILLGLDCLSNTVSSRHHVEVRILRQPWNNPHHHPTIVHSQSTASCCRSTLTCDISLPHDGIESPSIRHIDLRSLFVRKQVATAKVGISLGSVDLTRVITTLYRIRRQTSIVITSLCLGIVLLA